MTDEYMKEAIARYLTKLLDDGKKVYIESGAANDEIVGYEKRNYKKFLYGSTVKFTEEITFITSACIFPREITMDTYDDVDYEEFNGNIFVQVR